MRSRLHNEDGAAIVIAIALLAIMVTMGLASFALSDNGQRRSREQRERESSLNLAEAVLYSQGFALASIWPGNVEGGAAMPTMCSSATIVTMCPDPRTLAPGGTSTTSANFSSADFAAATTWTTRIRDNGTPIGDSFQYAQVDATQSGSNVKTGVAYSCPGPCKWDANGDNMLWVNARAVVRGRPRNVVALLKREVFAEAFAGGNAVTAGSFETTNNGNKTIIDVQGSQVAVRCMSSGPSCTDYAEDKNQVLPPTIVHDAGMPNAMNAQQLARFKAAAQSANPSTYYTSCPATIAGPVVYIDVPATTECDDDNNGVYNSATNPGIVIMPRGMLAMKGTYYGIVYMANQQNTSGDVLTLAANSQLFGGIAIDGPGHLVAGQASGPRSTIQFMPNAFTALRTFGTTGLVQNTWRELPAG